MTQTRYCIPVALLVAALVAVPVLLWGSAFAQDKGKDKEATSPVKWEYKVIRAGGGDGSPIDEVKMEEALNKLGKEGWECVGTVSEVGGGSSRAGAQGPNWTKAVLICKRTKT